MALHVPTGCEQPVRTLWAQQMGLVTSILSLASRTRAAGLRCRQLNPHQGGLRGAPGTDTTRGVVRGRRSPQARREQSLKLEGPRQQGARAQGVAQQCPWQGECPACDVAGHRSRSRSQHRRADTGPKWESGQKAACGSFPESHPRGNQSGTQQ